MVRPPDRTESAEYYFTYIDQVVDGDIRQTLESQHQEALSFFQGISDDVSRHRYAPDKWSVRQVLSHINDTERVFVFRALWFARGFDSPMPSFDQNIAIAGAAADERSWTSHIEEFSGVRAATTTFFRSLAADAWDRAGVASGHRVTVRALAYIAAGHLKHHVKLIQERYL